MSASSLTPEAKEAIRSYIYRGFALSGAIGVVLLSIVAYMAKDVLMESAKNRALETATEQIFEAQKEVSEAIADANRDKSEVERLLDEVQNMNREIKNLTTITKQNTDYLAISQDREEFEEKVAHSLTENEDFSSKVLDKIVEPNVFVLGRFKCSSTEYSVSVPVSHTHTDDWLVFGINPEISSYTDGKNKSGDNAVFSFRTLITPENDRQSWNINYYVEINHASDQFRKLRLKRCPSTVGDLTVVAIRAYNGIQNVQ